MTAAVRLLELRTPRGASLSSWGLTAYIWLLPFHIFAIAFLFGWLGWPGPVVRGIAAWKETLIALLFVLTMARVATGWGRSLEVRWLDLAVAGLIAVGLAYFVGAGVLFNAGLPPVAQLYGFRDAAFVALLYFVGRATPEAAESSRHLHALFVVGVITSVIAIVERLLVGPELLVLLGAARYVQDFLGAPAVTTGNVYGLPDNYWTTIGDVLVQRAGSVYLSAQGFAIPFLLIMPAATLWVTAAARARSRLAWLGYGLLWVALLLTVTRMTIAACLVQTVIILALRHRWAALVGGGITVVLAFLAILATMPAFAGFVWDTLTWQSGSSISHLDDWREGLENLWRHPLGVGLGATEMTAHRFGVTPLAGDNQYLRYGVELGLVGLALHLAVLGGAALAGLGVWRRDRPDAVRDTGLLVALTALGIAINAWTAAVFNSMLLAYVFFWLTGSVTTASAPTAPVRLP